MPGTHLPVEYTPQPAPISPAQILHTAPVAARPTLAALLAAQTRHTRFAPGTTVVVAVSGGADSVALLHALQQFAPLWQLSLHIAHLDHALRPESAGDADFVAKLAERGQLPFHTARLAQAALQQDPRGVEAAARAARYTFLRRVAWQVGNPACVVTAHHQDDQAETLLLHLVHGSGLQGLAGMAWTSSLPDDPNAPPVPLLRPFLGVDRATLRAYLAAYDLTWREDATNANADFVRNRLRHTILPALTGLNPNLTATLARSADLIAAEADYAAQRDAAALTAATLDVQAERWVLDLEQLLDNHLAVQRGLLRMALLRLGVDLRVVGLTQIDEILARAQARTSGGPHPLTAGWAWTLLGPYADAPALAIHRAAALPITPQHPHCATPLTAPRLLTRPGTLALNGWQLHCAPVQGTLQPTPAPPRTQVWQAQIDAGAVDDLFLTTPQVGMRIAPLGMGGRHKQLGDLFTDNKIPRALRTGWPVVVDQSGDIRVGMRAMSGRPCAAAPCDSTDTCALVDTRSLFYVKPTMSARANVKPLMHWLIYRGYTVRITARYPSASRAC